MNRRSTTDEVLRIGALLMVTVALLHWAFTHRDFEGTVVVLLSMTAFLVALT